MPGAAASSLSKERGRGLADPRASRGGHLHPLLLPFVPGSQGPDAVPPGALPSRRRHREAGAQASAPEAGKALGLAGGLPEVTSFTAPGTSGRTPGALRALPGHGARRERGSGQGRDEAAWGRGPGSVCWEPGRLPPPCGRPGKGRRCQEPRQGHSRVRARAFVARECGFALTPQAPQGTVPRTGAQVAPTASVTPAPRPQQGLGNGGRGGLALTRSPLSGRRPPAGAARRAAGPGAAPGDRAPPTPGAVAPAARPPPRRLPLPAERLGLRAAGVSGRRDLGAPPADVHAPSAGNAASAFLRAVAADLPASGVLEVPQGPPTDGRSLGGRRSRASASARWRSPLSIHASCRGAGAGRRNGGHGGHGAQVPGRPGTSSQPSSQPSPPAQRGARPSGASVPRTSSGHPRVCTLCPHTQPADGGAAQGPRPPASRLPGLAGRRGRARGLWGRSCSRALPDSAGAPRTQTSPFTAPKGVYSRVTCWSPMDVADFYL